MLAAVRAFFAAREVLEVETPLLNPFGVTDPHLSLFRSELRQPGQSQSQTLFLQPSPEYAMKRLLAAGAGSIYQICKAFRNEEAGRHHNPEFTLLEWYRVGCGLDGLMDDIEQLIAALWRDGSALAPPERVGYREIFSAAWSIDPIAASLDDFSRVSRTCLPEAESLCGDERSTWLELLFSHAVQPSLGRGRLTLVYDYPACLPSLARRRLDDVNRVERVEVFLEGLEIGNGFHELADAAEQEARFAADIAARRRQGLEPRAMDARLLMALAAGLPDCSGVALGLDRLLMARHGAQSLAEVLAFPIDRA